MAEGRHRAGKDKSTSEKMTGKRDQEHAAQHSAEQDRQAGIEATKALLRKRKKEQK